MTTANDIVPLLEDIVRERLNIPILQRQGRDFLDFHDISVWGLQDVLQAAYDAGFQAGRRRQ